MSVGEIDRLIGLKQFDEALTLALAAIEIQPQAAIFFVRAIDASLKADELDQAADLAARFPVNAGSALQGYVQTLHVALALIKRARADDALTLWHRMIPHYRPFAMPMQAGWKGPIEDLSSYAKQRLFSAAVAARTLSVLDRILELPGALDRAALLHLARTQALGEGFGAALRRGWPDIDEADVQAMLGMQALLAGRFDTAWDHLFRPALSGADDDVHILKARIDLAKRIDDTPTMQALAKTVFDGRALPSLLYPELFELIGAASDMGDEDIARSGIAGIIRCGEQALAAGRPVDNLWLLHNILYAYQIPLIEQLRDQVHSADLLALIDDFLANARANEANVGLWEAAGRHLAAPRDADGAAGPGRVLFLVRPGLCVNLGFAKDAGGNRILVRMQERAVIRQIFEGIARYVDGLGRPWRIGVGFGDAVGPVPSATDEVLVIKSHSFSATGAPSRCLHLKPGPLPDTFLVDEKGYSGWSAACDRSLADIAREFADASIADPWMAQELERVRSANLSKYIQPDIEPVETEWDGRTVLLALQIPHDSVMQHARFDFFAIADAVIRAHGRAGNRIFVKRHPSCNDVRVDALMRRIGDLPHVAVTNASIHSLIPQVDAVYVVNSGVGAEALLYGKAVHVFGRVDYQHACHQIADLDAIDVSDAAFLRKLGADHARYVHWYATRHHMHLPSIPDLDAEIARRIAPHLAGMRPVGPEALAPGAPSP